MKAPIQGIVIALLMLAATVACSTVPKQDLALEQVRTQLDELKSNQELAGYAPLALSEAERALRQAETATGDDTYRIHLVYMADRRIQIARAVAQHGQLEQEYQLLSDEHNAMLVKGSKLEAEQARFEAERARMMSAARAATSRWVLPARTTIRAPSAARPIAKASSTGITGGQSITIRSK